MVHNLTDLTFDTEVLQSKKPVLVAFTAKKGKPCAALAATLEKMSETHTAIKFTCLDMIAYPKLAKAYQVIVPPVVFLFHRSMINQFVGKLNVAELTNFLSLVNDGK